MANIRRIRVNLSAPAPARNPERAIAYALAFALGFIVAILTLGA